MDLGFRILSILKNAGQHAAQAVALRERIYPSKFFSSLA